MPAEPADLALAADFPAPSRNEWRALVRSVLAKSGVPDDVDPERALTTTTYDGIEIAPLYTAGDAPAPAGLPGRPPFVRGSSADGATATGWDVRVRHAVTDPTGANRAVLDDLDNGARSIWLAGDSEGADLGAVLEGVLLDAAPVVLDFGSATPAAADALLRLAERQDVAPGRLSGSLGADPLGLRARTGAGADLGVLAGLADRTAGAPGLCLATVDATVYHEAGASDAQELGIGTAVGVAYLRALTDAGLSVDAALRALEFRWAVTAEQFPSIAKLRAARRVWDRVAELCGASADRRGQRQHAVTSAAMLTRRDPWVNMLRTTIGCFAAAVGGADSITVLPFDSALGVSDGFARRIARNTQSVLHDESSLARVMDAAGGSWFVESLTDALAEKAWEVFTGMERAGGAARALDDGVIAELVGATQARRADDVAHRRMPITGVSEFAFVDEAPVERPPLPGRAAGDGALPSIRYAADFEALRDRADAAAERPTVFLAGLGPLAAYSARAGFAANLFQAGGIECVTAGGDVDELAKAFTNAGTPVACLCSSDAGYAEHAEAASAALRAAGATGIWLAGDPSRLATEGVDGYLHVGCDALAALRSTLDKLGVN
ncbi:MAG TPA: methylmalonyl-CoA mutase family protein [Jatrophihabitans sp.]|nr:methylmalonyl-CoA mutase family protein [Jatrophihabitans sp.]